MTSHGRGPAAGVGRERLPTDVRILVGAGFVVAVGYGIVAPAVPEYARSFDVGVTAASAVVSGFALVRLAFGPASGRLVGRLGEPAVFRCGLLIAGASSAASAFATCYAQLLIFRSLGGVGSTMFTVAAASLVIRMSPPGMRGRVSAAWSSGFLAGTIAGPVLGGGLIAIGLRAPFLAYAGLLGVVAAVLGARWRGRVPGAPVPQDGTPSLTFVAALQKPGFRAALASNFLCGFTVYGVRIALVPLFVVDVLRLPNGWSGTALTAFALGTVATLPLGGHLADRWGRRQDALAGRSNGAALAGYQMTGDLGAITGPVLAGWAVGLGGYPAAFGLTALIAVGSARVGGGIPRIDPGDTTQPVNGSDQGPARHVTSR